MFIEKNRLGEFRVLSPKISTASQLSTRWLLRGLLSVRSLSRGKLLDIGCGERPYESLFPHSQYIGVDWLQTYHDKCYPDLFMDAGKLPFRPASFDTILFTEVLEHVPDADAVLREIAPLLKKGGRLILSTPFMYWIHEAPYDYCRHTIHGLEKLLDKQGFEIEIIATRGGCLSVTADVFVRCLVTLCRRLLRKTRLPDTLIEKSLFFFAGLPQIALFRLLVFLQVKIPKVYALLDTAERLTLGYVIAAKIRS